MAIVGLGTDLVSVERIQGLIDKHGEAIALRLLTASEFAEWQQHRQQAAFLAKRFAAKEAAVKALGTGIALGIGFQHVQVSHDHLGKPILQLLGRAAERAAELQARCWHLSITDERTHAMATVILES